MSTEEKIDIKGRVYIMTRMIPQDALTFHARLMMCFGAILSTDLINTFSIKDAKNLLDDSDKQMELALKSMALIGSWSEHVDPVAIQSLIKDIVEGCKIIDDGNARDIIFNSDFDGKLASIYILFAKVVMFELSDFFSESSLSNGKNLAEK